MVWHTIIYWKRKQRKQKRLGKDFVKGTELPKQKANKLEHNVTQIGLVFRRINKNDKMRNLKIVEEEYWKELEIVGKFNGGKLHKLRKEIKLIRESKPKN